MEYLLSYALQTMECLSLCMVAESFFRCRISSKALRCGVILAFVGGSMLLIMFTLKGAAPLLRICVILAWLVFLLAVNYIGSLREKLLLAVCFFVVNSVIDDSIISLSMLLLDYSYDRLIYDKGVYIVGAFTAKTILLTSAALLAKARKRKQQGAAGKLSFASWLSMLIVPGFSIVIIYVIVRNAMSYNDVGPWVVVITIGLWLCNIVIIFLWNQLEKEQQTILENELLHHTVESKIEQVEALETAYAQQRRQTHDFRNHMRAVQGLLETKNFDKALAYVQNWTKEAPHGELVIHTHNPLVDMLLNQKYQAAQEKGVSMNFWVDDLAELPMTDAEFVTIIANLLDNAIEAASRCAGEKAVHVKIKRASGTLISVRNTSGPVEIVGQTIATTKSDPWEHGYGLKSIKRIIEQNHGDYSLSQDGGWVQFTAFFPESVHSTS